MPSNNPTSTTDFAGNPLGILPGLTLKQEFGSYNPEYTAINRPLAGAVSLSQEIQTRNIYGVAETPSWGNDFEWRGGLVTTNNPNYSVYASTPSGLTKRKLYAFVLWLDTYTQAGGFTNGELVFMSKGNVVGRMPANYMDVHVNGAPTLQGNQSKATVALIGGVQAISAVVPYDWQNAVGNSALPLPPDMAGATVRTYQHPGALAMPGVTWWVRPIYIEGDFDTVQIRFSRPGAATEMAGYVMLGCISNDVEGNPLN